MWLCIIVIHIILIEAKANKCNRTRLSALYVIGLYNFYIDVVPCGCAALINRDIPKKHTRTVDLTGRHIIVRRNNTLHNLNNKYNIIKLHNWYTKIMW